MSSCACGSGRDYDACCGPIISGSVVAPTAEAVMRSRYTAYVVGAFEHLERTLTPGQRKDFSLADAKQWGEGSEWLGFHLLGTQAGGPDDAEGVVEFSARFRTGGKDHEHVEAARFEKLDGAWLYAGNVEIKGRTVRRESPKVGRNDPCPCGSGKKYKRCCGAGASG